MTRDMAWKPMRKRSGRWRDGRLVLLLILVAVNVGVVFYHGNPWEELQKEKEPKKSALVVESEQTKQREEPAEVEKSPLEKPALPSIEQVPEVPELALEAVEEVKEEDGEPAFNLQPRLGLRMPGRIQRVSANRLKAGETVSEALYRQGVGQVTINGLLDSLRTLVDFKRLRAGTKLKARFDAKDQLVSFELRPDLLKHYRADFGEQGWASERIEVPVTPVVTEVSGRVSSSLWAALAELGEDPRLIVDVVDIFAWDIDFYSEVYAGDSFSLIVEKRYVEDRFLDYGNILAAEFISNDSAHRAFYYEIEEGKPGYYDEEGHSLRKQLLKTPLKYARVSSSFGLRKHPVLGYTKKHNGIDFLAPEGTAIWASGDGRVFRAGMYGGCGNMVEIRHANGWISQYCHLSKIQVRVGQRVNQKDVIGLVGSTGMATGPHLHYGLKRHGYFVNPAEQKFERLESLSGAAFESYKKTVAATISRLDDIRYAADKPKTVGEEG